MKGIIILAIAVLAFAGVILFYKRSTKIVDQVEPLGPFGLVTHFTRYRFGWNEGQMGTGIDEHYSLQYRGQPFSFDGKSGMFGDDTVHYQRVNSLITFPSPEPVVVVNVGDPNNSSFYYLVREVNGAAVAQHVADGRGGVSAEWLDPADDAKKIADVALHRGRMEGGGRYLLLGDYTVLDTQTLESYTFSYPEGAGHNQFKPPMEISPDRRSFVRWGSTSPPENHPALIVYDFRAPASYHLRLDRGLHRFNSWEEVDLAWLHHYFEWKKGENGFDRLVERSGVTPLPYHGSIANSGSDSYREYRLLPVNPEMKDTLAAFIEREMGGVRQPPAPQFTPDVVVLKVGEIILYVSDHEDHASVYNERDSYSNNTTSPGARMVEEVGRRFDEVLKTRKYDHLFLGESDE
jgi:hypothetical protein